jgi:hypothetical protein
MKIKVRYKYQEGYLPTPRCRKLRYRTAEDTVEIDIKEISKEKAPVALITVDFRNEEVKYRYFNDKLYTPLQWSRIHSGKKGLLPKSELHKYINGVYDYFNYEKEEVADSYREDAKKYIIIDDLVYKETKEPRYVAMTFGLGHNHGGTSLMLDNGYNPNISKDRYFNALERKKAIKYTKEIAEKRGDNESVDGIDKTYDIKVLIKEAVKCNPKKEHGDGDPFINKLNEITDNSSSLLESGLSVVATTNEKIKE